MAVAVQPSQPQTSVWSIVLAPFKALAAATQFCAEKIFNALSKLLETLYDYKKGILRIAIESTKHETATTLLGLAGARFCFF